MDISPMMNLGIINIGDMTSRGITEFKLEETYRNQQKIFKLTIKVNNSDNVYIEMTPKKMEKFIALLSKAQLEKEIRLIGSITR